MKAKSKKRHENIIFETGGLIALSNKKDASRVSSLEEQLKKGYTETAELNSALAQEGVYADNEALAVSEEKLMESE